MFFNDFHLIHFQEDYVLECEKEQCPPVTCPPEEHIYTVGVCCPTCPACYDTSQAQHHIEGDQWKDVQDPCIICSCKVSDHALSLVQQINNIIQNE